MSNMVKKDDDYYRTYIGNRKKEDVRRHFVKVLGEIVPEYLSLSKEMQIFISDWFVEVIQEKKTGGDMDKKMDELLDKANMTEAQMDDFNFILERLYELHE